MKGRAVYMAELWKKVNDFPNYEISNYGKVRNSKTSKELSLLKGKNNYLSVCLYYKGKGKRLYVHRLVAIAFLENPEGKPQVDHIDTNRTNNKVDNLQMVTKLEMLLITYLVI